ncbi:MAG TPA: site-2 protease family protein [Candidatus Marinimicrobia bacterium]|jgi:membrane-associated protease RseP (regulator of RpoE activity)|nr:site-2 protease family protein [Candidatus Neomarinimicrobiota bacterium]MDP7094606.1 site-2 protease family protein [Candidatus Neomarinimicrobiota bacterium]MDP7512315.1 site-2 protease family protein [Candidatus Neomarinimicrobiota bacterium]HBR86757.1 site-2 protease family protein [Candidatus Neomarinimicrobiota bacterium]HJL63177.1 site-2 protease family protein [Candidatus Neomarinimicrobiota bacterium]|tara:strand:- start:1868 stop:2944 length:1077 start_codon:yes stop_codon:yes gene_type:complete
MNEAQFRQTLVKLDGNFLLKQIGQSNGSWIAIGRLLSGSDIGDVQRILNKEPFDYLISSENEVITITGSGEANVILRIPKIPKLHLGLFLATVLTTLIAGAMMEGANIFSNPMEITKGIPFSFTLLLILGCHEFGHYYYAIKHNVDATLPYFIPAPPFLFLIGTFGAFIKIKSPIYRRDALLQIGAAGPIAGFIIAVPALIIGLMISSVVTVDSEQVGIILGDSILMKLLTFVIHPGLPENMDILLHPVAFAGWIGLLVTMLNLLPISQLDGGHIAYAMLGEKHKTVAKAAFLTLLPLSFLSLNWLIWGVLILVLMRSTKHPPIHDIKTPLSKENMYIGYACLVIFFLCFIPVPFQIP